MNRFEPRFAPLLLCLLLACASPTDSSRNKTEQVAGQPEHHGSTASISAALVPSSWSLTGQMAIPRSGHTATLLSNGKVLVTGGYGSSREVTPFDSAELYDPVTGTWSFTGTLSQARQQHTATLLPNGKVLVVGGKQGGRPLASAEVYDPAAGTWSAGHELTHARFNHTATLLSNGSVLVAAGSNGIFWLASAELYDPKANTWSPVGSLMQPREHHTSTLLPDGKVLVVAGSGLFPVLTSAEVYDPETRKWFFAKPLNQARKNHTATLLPGGKVLVVAGFGDAGTYLDSTEEYDVINGTWSSSYLPTGAACAHHSAVLLPDGKLLVVGGFTSPPWSSSASELYDPRARTWSYAGYQPSGRIDATFTLLPSGQVLVAGGKKGNSYAADTGIYSPPDPWTWSPSGDVSQARRQHTATLLSDGRVLVVGGGDKLSSAFTTVDMYDPATGRWSPAMPLRQARREHTATLLTDGRVLVVGGYDYPDQGQIDSVELYDPVTGIWSFTGPLAQARKRHTASLLPDGRVLVVGGYDGDFLVVSAEVYDPATGTWSGVGSLNQARGLHTATTLRNGKVLVVGGHGNNISTSRTAELYDPVTRRWTLERPMPRDHGLHTATLLADGKVLVVGGVGGFGTALGFAEVYDPDTGAWSRTNPLAQGRIGHTTTLLPGGRVLVVGGSRDLSSLTLNVDVDAEVYDPATDLWTSAGSLVQNRDEHTTTLLPGGKVLVVGGNVLSGPLLASTEMHLGPTGDTTWRPLITRVTPSVMERGTTVTVTGEHFRGGSESNGGNGHSSSVNHPLLSLSSVNTGRWIPLLGENFSDTSVSTTLPYVPNGYYLLHLTTQGVTSSRMISILNHSPPDTTLDVPELDPVTQSSSALFEFSSEEGASFECNLNGNGFSVCASPLHYMELREGEHVFQVRARDYLGNVDPTPASFHWMVDRTNPETWIEKDLAPRSPTHDTSARFTFFSEVGASFICNLDGTLIHPCLNPQDYSGLREGTHTLQVNATDRAGNSDPTAAEYQWTVDTTPPLQPEIVVPTPDQSFFTSEPVILKGTAEPGSTVKVSFDGTTLTSQVTADENGDWELVAPRLDWGSHRATAAATDLAGNISATSLEVSFAIVRHGYYGMNCAAAPAVSSSWLYTLLTLALWRRKRSP